MTNLDVTRNTELVVRSKPGRMLKHESEMKKRLFAEMLLQPDRYTRESICETIGISETTYFAWARDPKLPALAGFESNRYDIATKMMAAKLKIKALNTLSDVMDGPNDLARVRAAEVIAGMDTSMPGEDDVSNKKAAEKLLKSITPIFIVGGPDTLREVSQLVSGRPAFEEPEEEYDIIDGEFEEVLSQEVYEETE